MRKSICLYPCMLMYTRQECDGGTIQPMRAENDSLIRGQGHVRSAPFEDLHRGIRENCRSGEGARGMVGC